MTYVQRVGIQSAVSTITFDRHFSVFRQLSPVEAQMPP